MHIDRQVATGTLVVAVVAIVAGLGAPGLRSEAQTSLNGPFEVPLSLKTVPVPEPTNLGEFVTDRAAAIRLGKALFWDMQVGSDGIVACATCHFHAGADNRIKNQLHPGASPGDVTFAPRTGPNYTLKAADFPFHKLLVVTDRRSRVLSSSDNISGSQGVIAHRFGSLTGGPNEQGALLRDPVFMVGTSATRQTTSRNTPSVINAVFNYRNFWDGRAQNEFNGVNPFGDRDLNARVWKVTSGTLQRVKIRIENASLASQAVGPVLNTTEMSWDGRAFRQVGRKLLTENGGLMPLGRQIVHPQDSALGLLANSRIAVNRPGLATTYVQMIRDAFRPEWWQSDRVIQFDAAGNPIAVKSPPMGPLAGDTFTLMEANFSLFFGLAIQMYEATLVANDSPFDRFLEGNTRALTSTENLGFRVFYGKGRCFNCHAGPEMSAAGITTVKAGRIALMPTAAGGIAVHDLGFYNIGVRPTTEDPGLGGNEPAEIGGKPLSLTRMVQTGLLKDLDLLSAIGRSGWDAAVDGSFKAPGLRNVELTAPYFHNGGQATLAQVVEFYNRGGDFSDANIVTVNPAVQPLGLTATERSALVAFLKALTDPRVRLKQAPFDHPQLFIPNGHVGSELATLDDGTGKAKDIFLEIKAVGAAGGAALQPVFPQ
jgi:cytochrome c peroxidase